uniref:Uncharacterized protein n=1 Tax=Arundo donax TaxID=35708 RepID=A0A0A9C6C3_ARUDO
MFNVQLLRTTICSNHGLAIIKVIGTNHLSDLELCIVYKKMVTY